MESLTEDVVLEILVRVTGIPDLFRCATGCTRWRLLIADESFLRRRWPMCARHRSSLLGFVSHSQPAPAREEGGAVPWISPVPMLPFTATPWSPFGHRCPILDIPDLPPGHRATRLTSRCGLFLVRFIPHESPWLERSVKLAVCDPFAGKTHALPPLQARDGRFFSFQGYTLVTRADCGSKPKPASFFKVLILSEGYNLHAFTSGESSWTTTPINNPLDQHDDDQAAIIQLKPLQATAVVCQGTAHWLFKDTSSHYTLNVSTTDDDDDDASRRIFFTKLPMAPDQPGFDFYSVPVLSVTDQGTLSALRLYRRCTGVEMWIPRQGDNNNNQNNIGDAASCWQWHLAKTIQLQRPDEQQISNKIDMVQCVCVGEMSGTLLIKDNRDCMYIADLEAGTMENVTESFRGVVAGAIPLEMDWPAFFISRLALPVVP